MLRRNTRRVVVSLQHLRYDSDGQLDDLRPRVAPQPDGVDAGVSFAAADAVMIDWRTSPEDARPEPEACRSI